MDTSKVLIIVDLLNDFMDKEGALYCGETADRIVSKIKTRLDDFRSMGHPIIFLQDSHKEDDKEFDKFPKHCVKGTWGNEIIKEVFPMENEIIIEKRRFSGFYNTDLDEIMEKLSPESVFVTGVCTSICVMDTVGDLSNRDYDVVVPGEEVADFDPEMHEFALKRMKNLYGAKII